MRDCVLVSVAAPHFAPVTSTRPPSRLSSHPRPLVMVSVLPVLHFQRARMKKWRATTRTGAHSSEQRQQQRVCHTSRVDGRIDDTEVIIVIAKHHLRLPINVSLLRVSGNKSCACGRVSKNARARAPNIHATHNQAESISIDEYVGGSGSAQSRSRSFRTPPAGRPGRGPERRARLRSARTSRMRAQTAPRRRRGRTAAWAAWACKMTRP